MRTEFIINTGWIQIEDCMDCGTPVFTYKIKQAKRLSFDGNTLCPKCSMEELQIRELYTVYLKSDVEHAREALVDKMHEIFSRES